MVSKIYDFFKENYKDKKITSFLDLFEWEYAFFKIISQEFILIRKKGIFENNEFIKDLQNNFSLWNNVLEKGFFEFNFKNESFYVVVDDITNLNYIIFFKRNKDKEVYSDELFLLIFFQEIIRIERIVKKLPRWLEIELWNGIYRTSPILILAELGTGVELFYEVFFEIRGFQKEKIQEFEPAYLSKKVQFQELFGLDAGERLKTENVICYLEMELDAILIRDVIDLDIEVQQKLNLLFKEKKEKKFWVFISYYDIEKLVEIARFDSEFWLTLKDNLIILKPLRQIKEYLKEEVERYLNLLSFTYRRKVRIEEKALQKILDYDWPGNLYEFYKTLETAFLISKEGVIKEKDLIFGIWEIYDKRNLNLRECTEDLEKKLIMQAYRMVGGNQVHMAKLLGISRGSLQYKLSKYGFTIYE